MAKRKWYVVTVGRDIGVFPTWLEAGPLVKGVPNAIHQSFLTRTEATHMFAEEQARGRTRIVDPDLAATPAVGQPQRARNYSAPNPFSAPTSTFGMTMHRAHHASPLSVHLTTTSSRNRSSDSTPSPILLSDRRAPIVSGTSNSSPATWTPNPRSTLDVSPSMRRFRIIQATLEQGSPGRVTPARSQGQVRPADRTPLLFNTNVSNSRSLTPVPGPSSSSRTRALQRAVTPSHDIPSLKTCTPEPSPASASRNRETPFTSVGFHARAPSVSSGHSSHTNTYTKPHYIKPNGTTGGARISNPTADSTSQPLSTSRGVQRTPPHTPDTLHSGSRLPTFDSPGRSYASPRAVVRTPEWLPPYPTTRTPSPDSESSPQIRTSSPGPSDELLSPLSNVHLHSFALDNHPGTTLERNTPISAVNVSLRHPTPRRLNGQSQSPSVFANGTPHSSPFASTSTGSSGSTHLHGRPHLTEITHDSDPRSPILSRSQVPELPYCLASSALEMSPARPSPRFNSQLLTSSPLSNFSVNGHGSSLLFRH